MDDEARDPCAELIEVWLLNPFPDVALQALGHRILAEAFKQVPSLMEDDAYISLPEAGGRYDLDNIDPSDYAMGNVSMRVPFSIITNKKILETTGLDTGILLESMLKADGGIVKGTVRMYVAPDTIRSGWLTATIIWMGRKIQ
jgi:hypothetical protein